MTKQELAQAGQRIERGTQLTERMLAGENIFGGPINQNLLTDLIQTASAIVRMNPNVDLTAFERTYIQPILNAPKTPQLSQALSQYYMNKFLYSGQELPTNIQQILAPGAISTDRLIDLINWAETVESKKPGYVATWINPLLQNLAGAPLTQELANAIRTYALGRAGRFRGMEYGQLPITVQSTKFPTFEEQMAQAAYTTGKSALLGGLPTREGTIKEAPRSLYDYIKQAFAYITSLGGGVGSPGEWISPISSEETSPKKSKGGQPGTTPIVEETNPEAALLNWFTSTRKLLGDQEAANLYKRVGERLGYYSTP